MMTIRLPKQLLTKLQRPLLTAFFCCLALAGRAQKDGMLWKVTGNGITRPSYIFGTIHAHCNPDTIKRPALTKALAGCDHVALELDLGNPEVLMQLFLKSQEPSPLNLKDYLSAADYRLVDSTCKALLNDSLARLGSASPLTLVSSMMLSEKLMGCKMTPVDFKILEIARNAGKPTMGLESETYQDSLLKSIPIELQVRWLLDFCRDIPLAKAGFLRMLQAYNAGNCEQLYTLSMESEPEMNYLSEGLLNGRNLNWVRFLKTHMADANYFVAVGAAHLGGEKGLIALLRQAGYTVKAVRF